MSNVFHKIFRWQERKHFLESLGHDRWPLKPEAFLRKAEVLQHFRYRKILGDKGGSISWKALAMTGDHWNRKRFSERRKCYNTFDTERYYVTRTEVFLGNTSGMEGDHWNRKHFSERFCNTEFNINCRKFSKHTPAKLNDWYFDRNKIVGWM